MGKNKAKQFIADFYRDNFTPPLKSTDNQLGKKRIEFIDLAKGVCIFLVFYGHSNMALYFDIPILQSLRMPLYFFLSGLFFKSYGSLSNLIRKKFNKLIVPFFFFSILAIPLIFIQYHGFPIERLLAPLTDPRGGYNIVVWFLLCLFWCNIFFGLIYQLSSKMIFQAISVLIIGFTGCVLEQYKITLPLHITQSLMALPFFFAGYLTKHTPLLYKNEKFDKWLIPIGVTMILLCHAVYNHYNQPSFHFLDLTHKGNIALAYMISLNLVLGVLLICKAIGWLPIVSYLGRYSLIVLGLHWLVIKAYSIAHCILISKDFSIPLRFVVCLVCSWIAIPIFKSLFPAFTAQKDLIKWPKRLVQIAE